MITLNIKGALPNLQVQAVFEDPNKSESKMVTVGSHLCWFDETVANPEEDAAPNDGIRREWIALDDVVPMGRTALVALRKAQQNAEQAALDIDVSQVSPPPDNLIS